MVLVLILLFILILLLTFTTIIILSTLHIQIKNLSLSNISKNEKEDYAIIISLYLGNKIKWLKFNLNSYKIKRMYTKMQLEKLDFKKLENKFELKDIKELKKIQPKISYFNLEASLGLQSPITTTFLVTTLASVISIVLPHVAIFPLLENKYNYSITPIYQNQNLYKIKFDCIIEIKMVHIINVIYILIKKGKSDKNEQSTSNRKSYGYSYE